jgi:hypothetical protein
MQELPDSMRRVHGMVADAGSRIAEPVRRRRRGK